MKYHFLPIVLSIVLALAGCSTGTAGTEPPADDLASPPTITNADGVTLRIGMSRAECEEFFGLSIENGWQITNRELGVGVLSLDDIIVGLYCGEAWTLSNGMKTHMPIDEVRELLGEEDSTWPDDPEFQAKAMQHLIYQYDDGSALRIQFFKTDNELYKADTANNIVISGPGYDPMDPTLLNGTTYADVGGEGNAMIETFTDFRMVVTVLHTGEGAIRLYFIGDDETETEIFSGEGDCNGEGKLPLDITDMSEMRSLRVETEGEWRVVVKLPISSTEFSSGN